MAELWEVTLPTRAVARDSLFSDDGNIRNVPVPVTKRTVDRSKSPPRKQSCVVGGLGCGFVRWGGS